MTILTWWWQCLEVLKCGVLLQVTLCYVVLWESEYSMRVRWSSIMFLAWRLRTFWSDVCRPKFSNWDLLRVFITLECWSDSDTSGERSSCYCHKTSDCGCWHVVCQINADTHTHGNTTALSVQYIWQWGHEVPPSLWCVRVSVRSILLYVYIHNIPDMIILATLDRYRVHYATLMQVFVYVILFLMSLMCLMSLVSKRLENSWQYVPFLNIM